MEKMWNRKTIRIGKREEIKREGGRRELKTKIFSLRICDTVHHVPKQIRMPPIRQNGRKK